MNAQATPPSSRIRRRYARAPYTEKTLAEDEILLTRAEFHPLHWAWVIAVTLLTGWLVFPLIWLAPRLVRMATTELSLTNRRIILKTGWLRRDTNEMPLDSIENVQVHQKLVGRVLGLGRLSVHGAGGGLVRMPPIKDVLGFRKALEDAMPDRLDTPATRAEIAPHQ